MALGAVTIEKTHHTSWNENAGLQDRGVRILAVVAFLGGLLLAVRTMFFGVQRRLDDPPIQITISLLTPFAAYLPADRLHVSGVLAVVAAGRSCGSAQLLS